MHILKNLRTFQGVTQSDIADALGISQQAYANYETGKRQPDNEMLIKLSDHFNVSTDYLLGRVPPKESAIDPVTKEISEIVKLLTPDERNKLLDYARFQKSQIK